MHSAEQQDSRRAWNASGYHTRPFRAWCTVLSRCRSAGRYGRLKQVALRSVAHSLAADSDALRGMREMFEQLDTDGKGLISHAAMVEVRLCGLHPQRRAEGGLRHAVVATKCCAWPGASLSVRTTVCTLRASSRGHVVPVVFTVLVLLG